LATAALRRPRSRLAAAALSTPEPRSPFEQGQLGAVALAEEQSEVFVSIKDGPHSPALQEFWRNGGLRTIRNNQRLIRQLWAGPRLWLRSRETGRFGETSTYKWSVASHKLVIEKITRGLYYHHFGVPLSPTTRIEVTAIDRLYDEISNLVMGPEFSRTHIGGDDRFCYAYARVTEVAELSIWGYQVYNRHWATAVTEPDGFEFDEAVPVAPSGASAPGQPSAARLK
jgi:hypothetical protein